MSVRKLEEIFDTWLFANDEYRANHNPFLEMFAEAHKNMPVLKTKVKAPHFHINYMKPTLDQLSALIQMLGNHRDHFGIYNLSSDKTWEALSKMTLKQYKYLLFLIFSKHYIKAKSIFDELGVEHK